MDNPYNVETENHGHGKIMDNPYNVETEQRDTPHFC